MLLSGEVELNLDQYRYDAWQCVRCSSCKWIDSMYMKNKRFSKICPSSARYLFDAYSCQGRMDVALAVIDGILDHTPDFLDVVYKCTLCGACDIMCKRCLDMEPLQVLLELRAKCVQDGKGPMPAHRTFAQYIEDTHNPYGEQHEERLKWMPNEVQPARKADIIFFVGCEAAYKRPEIAQATVKILNSAGVDFMTMHPDEWCCGYPAYETGQLNLMRRLMMHNVEAIEESGASKVVTGCATCYDTLKNVYPRLSGKKEMGFETLHTAEYMDQLIKNGALKFSNRLDMKITYHDPCHLGRLGEPYVFWEGKRGKYGFLEPPKQWRRGTNGVYEAPRNVLKSIPGVSLIEMDRIRENAWCCGSGGGVKWAFNDFALWTAEERVEEAKTTGAEALVSCCPFCKTNFSDVSKDNKEGLKVYDISEIVLQAISKTQEGELCVFQRRLTEH